MNTNVERWKLMDFFDEEEILEPEGQIVKYKIRTDDGCMLILYVAQYEKRASLTLARPNSSDFVFELDIKNVVKIDCTETELLIYKKIQQHWYDTADFIITVKPNVRLSLDL
jgi:hypothetical protein